MRRGNLQTLGFFLLFVFVLFSLSEASTFIENKDQPFSFQSDLARGEFEQAQRIVKLTDAPYLAYETDSTKADGAVDVYGFKRKSVKRAFVYSLIVPGAGEFYTGSKIKAALFFGLDAALWAFFFNYRGKGKDKETEYKAHANDYWNEGSYKYWLWDMVYDRAMPRDVVSDTFRYFDKEKDQWLYFSHHLPDEKTDQYYEMIGKYGEQFGYGWTDYGGELKPDGTPDPSPRWNEYLDQRRDSNDLLNKAKYSAMFLLANHVLSAFDAALTVKRHNKRGEKFSQVEFKMRLVERNQELIPRLSATLRF